MPGAEEANGPAHDGLTRREFCKSAALGLGGVAVGGYLAVPGARAGGPGPLPPPIITGRSTEICLNSRVSRHSGLTGTATEQQIANVLWAAGRAPVTGSYRTIILRTHNGSYIYHPQEHALEWLSSATVTNAFRINYERERDFDAGVSYMFALMASVSLWTGTSSQLANCPQISDLNFGINSVPGLKTDLVAVSSDGSLPSPITDGANELENVLAGAHLSHALRTDLDLTAERLSQLLWAGYGCTPHWTASSLAGLSVPSWIATYFLTNRIYVVNDRVWRYSDRHGSDLTTRDHRVELVLDADVRADVRAALPGLAPAPCYVLLCLTQSGLGVWYQRLETGFVAGGMLAQAAALGLGCDFQAALSGPEQTQLKTITQIPAGDYPHAIVALGHRVADLDADGDVDAADLASLGACLAGPGVSTDPGCAPADLDADGDVDLTDVDGMQRS